MILERLAALVRGEGGLLAAALAPTAAGATPHGDLVAGGPRAVGHPADLPLVVEVVREGYLLHHHHHDADRAAAPRVFAPEDEDLALLAGDRLYALGLERLAAAGDLEAVAALADLIALASQASAAGDADLADAVWQAGAVELGWGPDQALGAAKQRVRDGQRDAAAALRAAARRRVGTLAPAR